MKKPLLLLLFACLSQFTTAQKESLDGVFAFVYNPLQRLPDQKSSVSDPVVEAVFNDLIQSKGVNSKLSPDLVITTTESVAAWALPSKHIIGIEQKALEICRSFGADSLNAMAGLLAHEMIHYYENHDWHNHFAHTYSTLEKELDFEEGRQMEMEADDMGGILAHMAGYRALDIMPKLLRKVYTEYNLDVNASTHYPKLEDRIKMAEISSRNLSSLIPIYDAAALLIAIDEAGLAANYLEHIIDESGFVSRELYNNLGVLYARSAYLKRPNQDFKFIYPFQLDLETRLGTKGINDQSFEALLAKAIKYTKDAQSLDENYAASYINLACMYLMRGDDFDAEYQLNKLTRLTNATNSSVDLVKGLLAAHQGDLPGAKRIWKLSADQNNSIAKRNLEILENIDRIDTPSPPQLELTIDGINLNKLYALIGQDQITPDVSIDLSENQSFHAVELESSSLYIHMDYENEEQYCFFHIIEEPNAQLPINVGASKKELMDYYGQPDMYTEIANGEILTYKGLNSIAVIQNGKILKWCLYKLSS